MENASPRAENPQGTANGGTPKPTVAFRKKHPQKPDKRDSTHPGTPQTSTLNPQKSEKRLNARNSAPKPRKQVAGPTEGGQRHREPTSPGLGLGFGELEVWGLGVLDWSWLGCSI